MVIAENLLALYDYVSSIQLEFRKAELESTMMTALTAYNMTIPQI